MLVLFQKEGKVVIQPADKNAGICILNREDYIKEANRQLTDTLKDVDGEELNYYKKSNEKAVIDQYKEIKKLIQEGVDAEYFSKDFGSKLLPKEPKSSNLYLLPKVHKQFETIPKGRPIIAACGSNTERISWLLDSIAKTSVKNLESYIEDTPDLLRYFEEVNKEENLPAGSKPYSIDIKSFYTNITLDEGIKAFEETLNDIPNKPFPTEYLIKLLKLVMGCNIFKFDEEYWIQLIGTSMGTRVAPTYANLFMGKLEKILLSKCPENLKQYLHTWKRFIDDIFIIWSGSCSQFEDFFKFINSYHPTIKFDPPQHNEEDNSCNFLDMKISIEDSRIQTDLYRKETTKPQALLPSSAHPGHITPNIVYSMAFRLMRICSREVIFEERLEELKFNFLIPRNYHPKIIDAEFKKVRSLPGADFVDRRLSSLAKKVPQEKQTDRLIAPFNFDPFLPKIGPILNKHFNSMVFRKPELKPVFKDAPMAALRQPPNMKKLICRSKLYPVSRAAKYTRTCHQNAPGWKKCGKGTTTCCPFALPPTTQVTGQVTGYTHFIQDAVNCQTENCIYYWKCCKNKCKEYPKCEYVGRTKRPFRIRLGEHKQYIRSEMMDKPSGYHFNQPGHNQSHLSGLVLEKVRSSDPFVLKAREFYLIQKFDTFNNGLNKEP